MSKALRLEWDLPDSLYDEVLGDEHTAAEDTKRALVLDWVRCSRVSVRRAAELFGVEYRDFLDVLAAHRVPVCDYEDGWIEGELEVLAPRQSGQ